MASKLSIKLFLYKAQCDVASQLGFNLTITLNKQFYLGRNAELIFALSRLQTDFSIDPKNGFLRTKKVFDREELVSHGDGAFVGLDVIVMDNGTPRLKDKVKVVVKVTDENDNAPRFLRTPYKVQVSEGSAMGAQILRLFAQDADEGLNGDVYYSILGGNDDGKFEIEETTGKEQISVLGEWGFKRRLYAGQIVLSGHLDRETTSKYTLIVQARDEGLVQLSTTTTVEVQVLDENDNAPEFAQTTSKISVSESTKATTELIRFKATDRDLGVNSEVSYSITWGNRKDVFFIDKSSGSLFLHKPLDYEDVPSYVLNVTAMDNGSPRLFSSILFSVAVEDANDNPPSFPSTAIVRQLKEGIPVRTPVVTVTASDPDSELNGNVSFSN